MLAIGGDDITAALLRLQIMFAHQAAHLLVVHHHALMTQSRTHPPLAVALELIADRFDPDQNVISGPGDGGAS